LTVIAGHFIYDAVRNTYTELKQNTQQIQSLQKQVADLKVAAKLTQRLRQSHKFPLHRFRSNFSQNLKSF
jgi:predicted transcriptional regulator